MLRGREEGDAGDRVVVRQRLDVGGGRGVEAILRMSYLVATERTRCRKFYEHRRAETLI